MFLLAARSINNQESILHIIPTVPSHMNHTDLQHINDNRKRWGWGVLFYGLCTGYYLGVFLYHQQIMDAIHSLPNSTQVLTETGLGTYAGTAKFLTVINLSTQTVYFFLSLLAHLTRYMRLRKLCEFLFASVVFPLGSFIPPLFWAIYAIDRELIYPKIMDSYIPTLMNHIAHTFIFLFIVLDMVVIPHFRALGLLAETLVAVLTVTGYTGLILWIRFHAGFWVYPIMNYFTYGELALFLLFNFCCLYGIQRGGVAISKRIWTVGKGKKE